MFRYVWLMLVVLLYGCNEPEKPIVVREITTTSIRYVPAESRFRVNDPAKVEFYYNDVYVYSMKVGSCTLIPEYKSERVVLLKAVYTDGIRYYIKEDTETYRANFLAKYCY